MKNYLAIATLSLLGLSPNQYSQVTSENLNNKPKAVFVQQDNLTTQTAKTSVAKTYAPKKDALVKQNLHKNPSISKIHQLEDEAIIKIVQNSPEDCKQLLDKYIKTEKVSNRYWEIALDSLKKAGKIKL